MSIRYIKKNEMDELLNLYTHLHRKDVPTPDNSLLISTWDEITTNSLLHNFVLEYDNKIVSCPKIPNLLSTNCYSCYYDGNINERNVRYEWVFLNLHIRLNAQ